MLWIFLVAMCAVVILLLLFQDKLIYHPRHYPADPAGYPGITAVQYRTAQGRQQAYYLAPAAGGVPRRLWVAFCGNASLAFDWVGFLEPLENKEDGFLLIEYPGYGACQGAPSPQTIEDSSEAAFRTLADVLKTKPAELDGNMNLICVSIGCGAGLDFAVHHPVKRVILIAPFTSLRDMARRQVGWPLCLVLRHNFDNRARLRELAARPDSPQVTIFHGDDDTTIPHAMGSELAGMFPAMIRFETVRGAGHNTITSMARQQILAAMRE
jgi:pimeloyl-ACP methyl ester carboxylesterase